MNRKLEKLENIYWEIGKVIGVLFTIINYQMWTKPFNIAIAVFLIIGTSVCTFVAINIIDLCVGIVIGFVKRINRKNNDRRVLKEFCKTGINKCN